MLPRWQPAALHDVHLFCSSACSPHLLLSLLLSLLFLLLFLQTVAPASAEYTAGSHSAVGACTGCNHSYQIATSWGWSLLSCSRSSSSSAGTQGTGQSQVCPMVYQSPLPLHCCRCFRLLRRLGTGRSSAGWYGSSPLGVAGFAVTQWYWRKCCIELVMYVCQ